MKMTAEIVDYAAPRAVYAVVIASLFLCGCATVNQFGSQVLSGVGLTPAAKVLKAGESLVDAIKDPSREETYYLGRAVSAEVLQRYPLKNDPAANSYLQRVGLVLAAHSQAPQTFGGWHFSVVNSKEVNALSAPGGFVFITSGMLARIPDEDALAAVLAHEIAHVVLNHGQDAISTSNLNSALVDLAKQVASQNCDEYLLAATETFGNAVGDVVTSLVDKGYSRSQEYEADEMAVELLAKAGYDPRAMITMLEVTGKAGEAESGGWFDTHPESEDRIDELDLDEPSNAAVLAANRAHRKERFSKLRR